MVDITIKQASSIQEAMLALDKTAEKVLLVVDHELILIGTLTDGDIRRYILKKGNIIGIIKDIYNKTPLFIYEDKLSIENVKEILIKHKIDLIPILNQDHKVIDYLTWEKVFGSGRKTGYEKLNVPVVIMAGGFGTRMEPFTKVLPKPLIPVHDKPIIEHIIDRFVDVGVGKFWITVNYKSRIMKAYFHDCVPPYTVNFVDEPEPMGTAGGLQFLKNKLDESFFVTNCDIIINADYRKIMQYHSEQGHSLTLVSSSVHYQIPYGTCILNNKGSLERIDEKPSYDFLVNTGMYVLNPEILDLIPSKGIYHITQLIEDIIKSGKTVGVFPVSEDAWIDVGQWKEFKRAVDIL